MKRRLLDQVRDLIRAKHYSHRTEKAYVHWIRRFILHHGKRHPADMGEKESGASSRTWRSSDMCPTMIYTRVIKLDGMGVHRPFDAD